MKTLDKLKAFSLEKKQMNATKGGARCTVTIADYSFSFDTDMDAGAAEKSLNGSYGPMGGSASCH